MSTESIKTNHITRKKPRPRQAKVTPKQNAIITLKNQNPALSDNKIATLAGTDPSYTIEVLKRYGLSSTCINDFKKNRAEILAGLQHRLISSITQDDIQKAPVGSRILAACQIYDKERLELGKTTNNTAVIHDTVARIKEMRDKINLFDEGEDE